MVRRDSGVPSIDSLNIEVGAYGEHEPNYFKAKEIMSKIPGLEHVGYIDDKPKEYSEISYPEMFYKGKLGYIMDIARGYRELMSSKVDSGDSEGISGSESIFRLDDDKSEVDPITSGQSKSLKAKKIALNAFEMFDVIEGAGGDYNLGKIYGLDEETTGKLISYSLAKKLNKDTVLKRVGKVKEELSKDEAIRLLKENDINRYAVFKAFNDEAERRNRSIVIESPSKALPVNPVKIQEFDKWKDDNSKVKFVRELGGVTPTVVYIDKKNERIELGGDSAKLFTNVQRLSNLFYKQKYSQENMKEYNSTLYKVKNELAKNNVSYSEFKAIEAMYKQELEGFNYDTKLTDKELQDKATLFTINSINSRSEKARRQAVKDRAAYVPYKNGIIAGLELIEDDTYYEEFHNSNYNQSEVYMMYESNKKVYSKEEYTEALPRFLKVLKYIVGEEHERKSNKYHFSMMSESNILESLEKKSNDGAVIKLSDIKEAVAEEANRVYADAGTEYLANEFADDQIRAIGDEVSGKVANEVGSIPRASEGVLGIIGIIYKVSEGDYEGDKSVSEYLSISPGTSSQSKILEDGIERLASNSVMTRDEIVANLNSNIFFFTNYDSSEAFISLRKKYPDAVVKILEMNRDSQIKLLSLLRTGDESIRQTEIYRKHGELVIIARNIEEVNGKILGMSRRELEREHPKYYSAVRGFLEEESITKHDGLTNEEIDEKAYKVILTTSRMINGLCKDNLEIATDVMDVLLGKNKFNNIKTGFKIAGLNVLRLFDKDMDEIIDHLNSVATIANSKNESRIAGWLGNFVKDNIVDMCMLAGAFTTGGLSAALEVCGKINGFSGDIKALADTLNSLKGKSKKEIAWGLMTEYGRMKGISYGGKIAGDSIGVQLERVGMGFKLAKAGGDFSGMVGRYSIK